MDNQRSNELGEHLEIEQLGAASLVGSILHGVGVTFGLALLWSLETIRNAFFRALDRMNVKAKPKARRASAFPPGRPRKPAEV